MRSLELIKFFVTLVGLVSSSPTQVHPHGPPTARARNGTYSGVYSDPYKQEFFLGIPYAEPPVGDLRFRNPRPVKDSWSELRPADQYAPACVGYGPSQMGYNVSEDCLYLNVIRPAGTKPGEKLPVAVWIHGGAFVQGSGVDLRYNMSFIVQQSQETKQPIIAITINYRLSAWGFLQGYETEIRGSNDAGSNWGLRDQRLALHWIQENIGAFGGSFSVLYFSRSHYLTQLQAIRIKSQSGGSLLVPHLWECIC